MILGIIFHLIYSTNNINGRTGFSDRNVFIYIGAKTTLVKTQAYCRYIDRIEMIIMILVDFCTMRILLHVYAKKWTYFALKLVEIAY